MTSTGEDAGVLRSGRQTDGFHETDNQAEKSCGTEIACATCKYFYQGYYGSCFCLLYNFVPEYQGRCNSWQDQGGE